MVKINMKENGNIVGTGTNDDYESAKRDAIDNYYINGEHSLKWDDLWDLIDDDYFLFEEVY